jgi:hypothetical protein
VEKPEWAQSTSLLRKSSRGARLKAGNSLRMERKCSGIQVLGDDGVPESLALVRTSSKSGPPRTNSREGPPRTHSKRNLSRTSSRGSLSRTSSKEAPFRTNSRGSLSRTSSRDSLSRSTSKRHVSRTSSKRQLQIQQAVAETVRVENGQILWESPVQLLRSTTRGSLLLKQQSIRNSKCVPQVST